MYPFPTFNDVTNIIRQLPTTWWGKLLPGRKADELPVPKEVREDTERFALHEKIVSRVRTGSNKIYFLPIQDSYTDETEKIRNAYRVMLRDPTVKAALLTKILGVAHLDLQVQPASPRSIDRMAAEFVKWNLEKIRGGTRHLAWNILFGGLIDGFSVCEKVIDVVDRGRWKGLWYLKKLKAKDTKTLRLLGDDYRNVTAVQDMRTTVEYNPSNFVIFSHMSLFESPTGMSDLRAAYRAYWMLDTVFQLRAMGLERYSLPMLLGEYDHPDRRQDLEDAMENARQQTWMSLPVGCRVTALEMASRGQADFQAATDSLRQEIVLSITGALLQLLEGNVSNGAGNSQVHKSTSELYQWMLAGQLGDVQTDQIAPDLVEWNFEGADYPIITYSGVNDANLIPSLQIDTGLQQMGLDLSKDELYKKYSRQKPENAADTLQSPMSYQKEQAEQQMAMQQMMGGLGMGDPTAEGGDMATELPSTDIEESGATPGIQRADQAPQQPTQMAEDGTDQGAIIGDAGGTVAKFTADDLRHITQIQKIYHRKELSREAAIGNMMTTLGIDEEEAAQLFPDGAKKMSEQDEFCDQGPNKGKPGPCPDNDEGFLKSAAMYLPRKAQRVFGKMRDRYGTIGGLASTAAFMTPIVGWGSPFISEGIRGAVKARGGRIKGFLKGITQTPGFAMDLLKASEGTLDMFSDLHTMLEEDLGRPVNKAKLKAQMLLALAHEPDPPKKFSLGSQVSIFTPAPRGEEDQADEPNPFL